MKEPDEHCSPGSPFSGDRQANAPWTRAGSPPVRTKTSRSRATASRGTPIPDMISRDRGRLPDRMTAIRTATAAGRAPGGGARLPWAAILPEKAAAPARREGPVRLTPDPRSLGPAPGTAASVFFFCAGARSTFSFADLLVNSPVAAVLQEAAGGIVHRAR